MPPSHPHLSPLFLPRVRQELRIRGYSPRTVATYLSCLRRYVEWLHPVAPRDAGAEAPRAFLLELIEAGASRTLVDQHVSALKFVYLTLYGWDDDGMVIPRPRSERRLPRVPRREEVLAMAATTRNLKHRLAILMLYGSGVRVSELVGLDVGDVDAERLLVRVRNGKGRKDRLTILSARLVPAVRALAAERSSHAPLFESNLGGRWSARSVQHVVQRARARAGVDGPVTPHSLRHAFATHLLEAGTSLRVIQGLLGHANVQTTVRYTQMTDPHRMQVRSPL